MIIDQEKLRKAFYTGFLAMGLYQENHASRNARKGKYVGKFTTPKKLLIELSICI